MAVSQYIVKEGDKWDTVAFKAYGDSTRVSGIIEANPSVPITAVLIAGTPLVVPILEDGEILIDSELLPPWKR